MRKTVNHSEQEFKAILEEIKERQRRTVNRKIDEGAKLSYDDKIGIYFTDTNEVLFSAKELFPFNKNVVEGDEGKINELDGSDNEELEDDYEEDEDKEVFDIDGNAEETDKKKKPKTKVAEKNIVNKEKVEYIEEEVKTDKLMPLEEKKCST